MENQSDNGRQDTKGTGFMVFATKRIIVAAVLIVLVVWVLGIGLNSCGRSDETPAESGLMLPPPATGESAHLGESPSTPAVAATPQAESSALEDQHPTVIPAETDHETLPAAMPAETHAGSVQTATAQPELPPVTPAEKPAFPAPESHPAQPAAKETAPKKVEKQPEPLTHAPVVEPEYVQRPRGVTFVEGVIKPLDHELHVRFWGWRPNDILNFTDNVNNFQLGVLEVTRRSVVMLTERISRTGSTDAFNQHLEDAANWLMVTATRYWFPSPESKYEECIKELNDYKQELIKKEATFYIRTDNLIPLLASYEDLLGSCDENLIKRKNEDGTDISYFKADDYFYYAQGVASALATILEAIQHDFLPTLESRHGAELLHHALLSCRQAAEISPLLIMDRPLDGIIANHRANMAAPISHARYFLGQLIKTLST